MARLRRGLGDRLALAAGAGEGGGHCQTFPAEQGLFIPRFWPCPAQGPCHLPLKTALLHPNRPPCSWAENRPAAGTSRHQAACETSMLTFQGQIPSPTSLDLNIANSLCRSPHPQGYSPLHSNTSSSLRAEGGPAWCVQSEINL